MNVGLPYVVLRTHARLADLLTEEQMKDLAEANGLDGFLAKLGTTPYGRITIEDDNRPDIALERVFYEKFIDRIELIVKLTPEKMGDYLMSYYQMRFEVVNLKRILRGKFSEASEEEIKLSLIPIKPYKIRNLDELIKADNLEQAVEMLKDTPYGLISSRLPLYKELDALWPFELMLNYINALAILKGVKQLSPKNRFIIKKLVQLETDIENLLIAFKQRGKKIEDLNLEELFPATYGVEIEKLKELIEAKNVQPVIQGLGSPYAEILGPIYEGDVALIRTYLRLAKYEHAKSSRAADEFGFNVIMAYLVFSEIEKDNLVGIAWGKAQGLPPDELLKYVVIPRG
jgi:V/A-type H+-transporting ATPase subunit C